MSTVDILAYTWTGIGFFILMVSVMTPLIAWEEWKVHIAEGEALLQGSYTPSEKIISDSGRFLSRWLFIKSLLHVPMNLVITSAGLIAILIPPDSQQSTARALMISSMLIGMEVVMASSQVALFVILYGLRRYRQMWYRMALAESRLRSKQEEVEDN